MFYERLKALCDRSGTTISAFVESMGGSKGSPSNWKRGALPNCDIVVKAARHFGVTCDYLLGLSDIENASAQSESMKNNAVFIEPSERAIIEALRTASPDAKAAAVASFFSVLGVLQAKNAGTTYCNSEGADSENESAV